MMMAGYIQLLFKKVQCFNSQYSQTKGYAMIIDSSSRVSHYLGTPNGWRKKRLKIALALRNQGWTHQLISEYLEVSPKSLMRDIKCYVIDPQGLNA